MKLIKQYLPGVAATLLIVLAFVMPPCLADSPAEGAPGQSYGADIVLNGANEASSLTLTASIENPNWALVPGTTVSETGTITLSSESAWQITVSADRADGKMFPHDGSQYVAGGKSLQDSLSVAAEGGVPVDLAAGGVLISGTGSANPVTKTIFFSQPVTWNNAALPHGQTYNLGITFIISPVVP
jgi:hypothetical protein